MAGVTKMLALMSRGADTSPTGCELRRGDEYDATPEQARIDVQRGFGRPVEAIGRARKRKSE